MLVINRCNIRTWVVLNLLDLWLHGRMGLKDVGTVLHGMLHLRAHLAHIGA